VLGLSGDYDELDPVDELDSVGECDPEEDPEDPRVRSELVVWSLVSADGGISLSGMNEERREERVEL
jgi:uncharacterized tellurite resistance protein B-like protein